MVRRDPGQILDSWKHQGVNWNCRENFSSFFLKLLNIFKLLRSCWSLDFWLWKPDRNLWGDEISRREGEAMLDRTGLAFVAVIASLHLLGCSAMTVLAINVCGENLRSWRIAFFLEWKHSNLRKDRGCGDFIWKNFWITGVTAGWAHNMASRSLVAKGPVRPTSQPESFFHGSTQFLISEIFPFCDLFEEVFHKHR